MPPTPSPRGSGAFYTAHAARDVSPARRDTSACLFESDITLANTRLPRHVRSVLVVTAAGNFRGDACDVSPARVPSTLTTAASDSADVAYSWGNDGACVDVYAPGVDVVSACGGSKRCANPSDDAFSTQARSPACTRTKNYFRVLYNTVFHPSIGFNI